MGRIRTVVSMGAGGHRLARLGRVLLVGQRPGRDVDESRIRDVYLSIGDRPRHRFDQQARPFRARPAVSLQVVALEEVEHLEQRQSAGGRTCGGDSQAAITSPEWLGHIDPVAGEVFPGDEPAVGFKIGGYGFGNLALVEGVRSVLRQTLQSARVISLDELLADG